LEPLSSVVIINTSINLNKKIRDTGKRRFYNWLQTINKNVSKNVISQLGRLLYSKSEGLLWAKRLELSHEKALLFPGETFNRMLEKISPDKILMQQLPFYYANLFSGKSSLSKDVWVGMEEEIEKGSRAIKCFLSGASGMVIITGERSSGKSSLSKHIANLHFEKQNTFIVKAPKECIANKELFEQTLIKSLGGKESLKYSMDMLHAPTVIIIDDIELWWQRKPSGTQVVEKIISLMQQYSHKVLFIVNVNKYALKIINQLCSINSWAIDLVFCQPLDAHELKDLILTRHQAGGLKFILNKKHENEMTTLDYARLFNSFFNLSSGNPGYALNLWLAGIRKFTGNIIEMEKPLVKEISFPENLHQDEIIYILQFILHRRFSLGRLSEVLQNDIESTEKAVRILLQKGILVEKFPEVYSLNPALEIHLVKDLKSLELL
jgi:energy-coupling factor transporter ATP-binding protein EcfA2